MKLHDWLITLRRRGMKPTAVWLHVDTDPGLFAEVNREPNGWPHVVIEPDDSIPRLDLRWVVGCTVYVHGDGPRVMAAYRRCLADGAHRVIAFDGQRITDSASALQEAA